MDEVLLPYLEAADSERERVLSDLLLLHAAPVVRHTLRQKLGFYINPLGANPHNQDAEDLYYEVITRLLHLLNDLQSQAQKTEIRNFRYYVSRLAMNACYDYLRAKSPARARLKNSLRDLLDRHSDFAMWKTVTETLCGFAVWQGGGKSASSDRLTELIEKPEVFQQAKFSQENVQQVPLTRLAAEIFRWVDSPIELDALVSTIALLLNVKDHPVESLDNESDSWNNLPREQSLFCESRIEAREILAKLWEEIRHLNSRQRDAICFGFEDARGDDLFSLLLEADLVTWSQLSQGLDRTVEELMRLWQQMPMDNHSIADELGVSRQQVYKWRFEALKHLQKAFTLIRAEK